MNTKLKISKSLFAVVVGLLLSTSVAYAAPAACNAVPMTVVNSSAQDVSVRGSAGVMVIPAHSSTQVAFQSKHFYTKCGLVEVSTDGQTFQKGLIAEASNAVAINVQASGDVQAIGLTEPGFKLDDYISWWGLGAVLA